MVVPGARWVERFQHQPLKIKKYLHYLHGFVIQKDNDYFKFLKYKISIGQPLGHVIVIWQKKQ